MAGFGKVFDSIFDSTLMSEGGWLPTYIFVAMIALADKDGIVSMPAKALFRRMGFREYDCKIDFSDFEAALRYLEAPDPDSDTPDHEGRRIIPLSDIPEIDGNRGWWIVNHAKYREKGTSTDRVRRHRAGKKIKDLENGVTESPLQTVPETHTDTDTDTSYYVTGRGDLSLAKVWEHVESLVATRCKITPWSARIYLKNLCKNYGDAVAAEACVALLNTTDKVDPKAWLRGACERGAANGAHQRSAGAGPGNGARLHEAAGALDEFEG